MSLNDDLTAVQRCLDDLVRSVTRLEDRVGAGGLEIRRVRTDADHLREKLALLADTADGPARTRTTCAKVSPCCAIRPPARSGRAPRWFRSPTPRTTARCGRTSTTRVSARAAATLPSKGSPGARPTDGSAPDRPPHHSTAEFPLATGTDPQAATPPSDREAATSGVRSPSRAAIPARHLRTDRWWLAPAVTAAGLFAFVVYSTWRAFAGDDYYAEPYVSPFYSPCVAQNCVPMKGGANWEIFGAWWGLSPALLILIFPLGFRLTCYYYRKAYYRGFWASPPACAVAEPRANYTGETRSEERRGGKEWRTRWAPDHSKKK